MSCFESKKINNKKEIKNEKSSEFIDDSVIVYIDKENSADFENWMINGYKEMAEINLELSMVGFEKLLNDFNEYEAWLCGV
ncbi:hypothetical protein UT300005_33490 [Clostridium sp. CTA-5]